MVVREREGEVQQEVHQVVNGTMTVDVVSREEVLRTLHTNAMHIQMCVICLYGGRSPMLRHFIFGKTPTQPIH